MPLADLTSSAARPRHSVKRFVLRLFSERDMIDDLLRRVRGRLNGPYHATDDWTLEIMLNDAGKLIAKRAGREAELRSNPPQPVTPK